MMKKRTNPINTKINTSIPSVFSIASGSRCMNAPPISTPADKLTSIINIFFNSCSFIDKAKIPIKAINAIAKVDRII
jgi:hypothetical protein